MDETQIKHVVEAALLAAGRPLPFDKLASLFATKASELDKATLQNAIESLASDYKERGLELKEVSSGYRIQIKRSMSDWLIPLWDERAPRYTRALLETLALVAYRQPITRAEIEEVRGVAVSTNIMRTLLERSWVRVVGHRDVPGKPAMFGTTKEFLDYFGLKKLEDLPPLADVKDGLPELIPQSDLIDALEIGSEESIPDEGTAAESTAEDGTSPERTSEDDEAAENIVAVEAALVDETDAAALAETVAAASTEGTDEADAEVEDVAERDDLEREAEAETADDTEVEDADDAEAADDVETEAADDDETDVADDDETEVADDNDDDGNNDDNDNDNDEDEDEDDDEDRNENDDDEDEVQVVVAHASGTADDESADYGYDSDDYAPIAEMEDSEDLVAPNAMDGMDLQGESADDWGSESAADLDKIALENESELAALELDDDSDEDRSGNDEVPETDMPLSRSESN